MRRRIANLLHRAASKIYTPPSPFDGPLVYKAPTIDSVALATRLADRISGQIAGRRY